MEKVNIDILLIKRVIVPRQTENMYFQALIYDHLWKEVENNQIENIFIVSISDQFYNPDTKKELVNSIEVHFKIVTKENILNGYIKPEERHPDAIPFISSMTFEANKILRADTLKQFDKSQFKNIELPDISESKTLEIVGNSLPKMDKSKMPITLVKEDWLANYIITMFSIIGEATSSKDIIIEGNKITFREKEKEEIFEFTENLNDLKVKIFEDFFRNPMKQQLNLTKAESDLFRRCSHAAYFFETERNKVKNPGLRNLFMEQHERFFKS
jgi:hypothetical protein